MKVVRLVYYHPTAKAWFPTTYVPLPLAPVIRRYYASAPGENPLRAQRFAAYVYLDMSGPVYGPDNASVKLSRGYTVSCPLSHADVLAATLLGTDGREDIVVEGEALTFFFGMYHRAVVWTADLPELQAGLLRFAEEGGAQRLANRTLLAAEGHVHVAGLAVGEA